MVNDFTHWLRGLQRRDLILGAVAFAITASVLIAFLVEQRFTNPRAKPTIIYAESWAATRTRADTLRVQRRNESARQLAIAEFEGQRAEALLRRARGDAAKAQYQAAIARYKADAVRWARETAAAERDLAANPPARAVAPAARRALDPPVPRPVEPIRPIPPAAP